MGASSGDQNHNPNIRALVRVKGRPRGRDESKDATWIQDQPREPFSDPIISLKPEVTSKIQPP